MPEVNVSVPIELTFDIEVSYTPGGPATGPSYASGGDPAYGPEWEMSQITSISYSKRIPGKIPFEYAEYNLLDEIKDPNERNTFMKIMINALLSSKLEEDFGDAVSSVVEEDSAEPDYEPYERDD